MALQPPKQQGDEDEGSSSQDEANQMETKRRRVGFQDGKIERSAEALRSAQTPTSFPPVSNSAVKR